MSQYAYVMHHVINSLQVRRGGKFRIRNSALDMSVDRNAAIFEHVRAFNNSIYNAQKIRRRYLQRSKSYRV